MKGRELTQDSSKFTNPPRAVVHHLKDDGRIPNNAKLPLVTYEHAVRLPQQDAASAVENLLKANNWGGSWRDGIYSYHHYHSTAHEVLVVFRGTAKVQLGGEKGITINVQAGDAVVIPAGVAHKNLGSSDDFAVVGAYPEGQKWDMNYGEPGERPKTDENIARVPLPKADPIYGKAGPLNDYWKL